MAKYKIKLNNEESAFVCDTQMNTEKAIKLFKRRGYVADLDVHKKVSDEFRGYYFAGVIGFIHRIGMYPELAKLPLNYRSKKTKMSLVDVYHEFLKEDFNGIDLPDRNGGIKTIGMSIAVRDSSEFTDYIERINADISKNYSMRLPTPKEYKKYLEEEYSDYNAPEFVDFFYNQQLSDII